MTPRRISSGVSCRILLAAPRILKAPMGWRLSALSQMRLPVPWPESPGKAASTSGVLTAMEAMRAAAARISAMETSFSSILYPWKKQDFDAALRDALVRGAADPGRPLRFAPGPAWAIVGSSLREEGLRSFIHRGSAKQVD